MAKPKVSLDHAGIRAILSGSEVADLIQDAAAQVVSHVQADPAIASRGLSGEVDAIFVVTDRAKAIIAITDRLGRPLDAKYSIFDKAIGSGK